MSLIQAAGWLAGDAASFLSGMTAGTWFVLADIDYQLVTVAGQSPAAGKVFAHRLQDGRVVQLDETQRADQQAVGAFTFAALTPALPADGNAPAADTLGDVALGGFIDTATSTTPNGKAARKVEVLDAADPPVAISPGIDNSWRLVLGETAVQAIADASAVESWGVTSATAFKVQ